MAVHSKWRDSHSGNECSRKWWKRGSSRGSNAERVNRISQSSRRKEQWAHSNAHRRCERRLLLLCSTASRCVQTGRIVSQRCVMSSAQWPRCCGCTAPPLCCSSLSVLCCLLAGASGQKRFAVCPWPLLLLHLLCLPSAAAVFFLLVVILPSCSCAFILMLFLVAAVVECIVLSAPMQSTSSICVQRGRMQQLVCCHTIYSLCAKDASALLSLLRTSVESSIPIQLERLITSPVDLLCCCVCRSSDSFSIHSAASLHLADSLVEEESGMKAATGMYLSCRCRPDAKGEECSSQPAPNMADS